MSAPTEVRTCGRPTRSGKPCKVHLRQFERACGRHATEHDRELALAHERGHREGFERGRTQGAETAQWNVERLERRVKELEQLMDEATRIFEVDGDQVVDVGGHAYRWRGNEPLEAGARVLLPENWLSRIKGGPGPYEGVVTKLGTTYRGELSFIISRRPTERVSDA